MDRGPWRPRPAHAARTSPRSGATASGHAAGAVLRPRVRAGADAVHGADGGRADVDGLAKGVAVLGVLWWSLGRLHVADAASSTPTRARSGFAIFAAMAGLLVAALCVPGRVRRRGAAVRDRLRARAGDADRAARRRRPRRPGLRHSAQRPRGQHGDRRRAADRRRRSPTGRCRARCGRSRCCSTSAARWSSTRAAGGCSPEHFAERHGLIVIIALGESIVAIGVGAEAGVTPAWSSPPCSASRSPRRSGGCTSTSSRWSRTRRLEKRRSPARERNGIAPRLLLLPALPDGRRDRAGRARDEEDARAHRRGAEARARRGAARRHGDLPARARRVPLAQRPHAQPPATGRRACCCSALMPAAVEIPALATLAILAAVLCGLVAYEADPLRRGARARSATACCTSAGRALSRSPSRRPDARVEPHDRQVGEQADARRSAPPPTARAPAASGCRAPVGQPGSGPSARRMWRKKPGSENTHSTSTMFVTMIGAEAPNSDATVDAASAAPAWRRTTRRCGTGPWPAPCARSPRPSCRARARASGAGTRPRSAAPTTIHGTSIERRKSHGFSSGGS